MLQTTIEAIRSIVRADPSVTPQERARILDSIRNHGKAETSKTTPNAPRILRRDTVAERLGCTVRQVDNLAREGTLRRVVMPGRTRAAGFRESDVMALIAGGE